MILSIILNLLYEFYTEKETGSMLIDRKDSCLLIIDVQEHLAPAVKTPRDVISGSERLAKGAKILNVPVIATEQYPKGLGPTMFDVRSVLSEEDFFEKRAFSVLAEEGFEDRLKKSGAKQVVITGAEMHICVLQSAIELKEQGYVPFVVENACSSRYDRDFQAAKARLANEGITVVTVEMVLFEWLRTSKAPEFKQIQSQLVF